MTKHQTKIAESRNALQEARKMSDHELLSGLAALSGFIENTRTRHMVLEGVRRYLILEREVKRNRASPPEPSPASPDG